MPRPYLTTLTDTHLEILQRFANGEVHKDIAIAMHYSNSGSISYHIRTMLGLLNAKTITEAVYLAMKEGIIK